LKIAIRIATVFMWLFSSIVCKAQVDKHAVPIIVADSTARDTALKVCIAPDNCNDQLDVIDIIRNIAHKGAGKRADTETVKSSKFRIAGPVPAAGYSLNTGLAGVVTANASFYTRPSATASTMLTAFTYTANNQIILPFQANFWTNKDKYNIVVDWRYVYFPSLTYGLGGFTSTSDGYLIDYSAIRIHQAVLRELAEDMYAGIGYNLDYYWNIKEVNPPPNTVTDFENYGFQKTEFASGFTFNFLYDTRKNSINPDKGYFVNVIYRPNLTLFGNTANWRSLIVDLRKYIKFPADSRNVLAFWSYEWLTVDGKAPYLMLPNTGGDPYTNTGRGYIPGRFRGANMAYLEGEYRFAITNNGLLGGVVFANAESFTEQSTNTFQTVAPGWGAGIRLKLNKFSKTNVALDYGFGLNGSGGLFVNLGEIF
jgi:surface antigen Omp85-like protein